MEVFLKDVRSVKNESGFSLVELMVVVAIIGILASLAIPSVGKYMAKARQSEAKTQLSSIYTAEKAFYAEYTAYHSMFGAVGYSPEGKLRYNVGFSGPGVVAGVVNGYNTVPAAPGNVITTITYCGLAGVIANGCAMLNGSDNTPAGTAAFPAALTTAVGFTIGASGRVFRAQDDVWTMDQDKVLLNPTPGIN